jgi:putative endonuclease
MYTVYILKSDTANRYYIGHTADLELRLKQHNAGKVKSTKGFRPWKVSYTEAFDSKGDAFKREMQIKKYRHGEAFRKLISE